MLDGLESEDEVVLRRRDHRRSQCSAAAYFVFSAMGSSVPLMGSLSIPLSDLSDVLTIDPKANGLCGF